MNRSLIILCLIAATAAVVALVRLDAAATRAESARQELSACRKFLADPARRMLAQQLGLLGSPTTNPTSGGGDAGMETSIRQAVTTVGLSDRLRTIEWTKPSSTGVDEPKEVLGFLHFDNVTLEQLTRFLHHLADADPNSRTQMIELAAPRQDLEQADKISTEVTAPPGVEVWSADVTVAYRVRSTSGRRLSDRP